MHLHAGKQVMLSHWIGKM